MFKLTATDSETSARTGELVTQHGVLKTPVFMPVATKGSVKYASNEELRGIGFDAFICNAFILSLKPGLEVIGKAGSLHSFINWDNCIFTDSGGFQLLSEDFLLEITDNGIWFRNPFNGEKTFLTPKQSIEIQNCLGSDVAVCLDDVPHYGKGKSFYASSLKRTLLWVGKCRKAHKNKKQLLFAISQGGVFRDLREHGLRELIKQGFDGIALGGLCIGEKPETMHKVVSFCNALIPVETPRYLMGVGSPAELLDGISLGVDIFDSCFPARIARHGTALTSCGKVQINKACYSKDLAPLDEKCGCFVCRNHSRAFIHHLVRTREENGLKYMTYHNLWFTRKLIEGARLAIKEQSFMQFKQEKLKELARSW